MRDLKILTDKNNELQHVNMCKIRQVLVYLILHFIADSIIRHNTERRVSNNMIMKNSLIFNSTKFLNKKFVFIIVK